MEEHIVYYIFISLIGGWLLNELINDTGEYVKIKYLSSDHLKRFEYEKKYK